MLCSNRAIKDFLPSIQVDNSPEVVKQGNVLECVSIIHQYIIDTYRIPYTARR